MGSTFVELIIDACDPERLAAFCLRAAGCDQATELERRLTQGARRADVGQADEAWVVLADPEGNEFCLLGDE